MESGDTSLRTPPAQHYMRSDLTIYSEEKTPMGLGMQFTSRVTAVPGYMLELSLRVGFLASR